MHLAILSSSLGSLVYEESPTYLSHYLAHCALPSFILDELVLLPTLLYHACLANLSAFVATYVGYLLSKVYVVLSADSSAVLAMKVNYCWQTTARQIV